METIGRVQGLGQAASLKRKDDKKVQRNCFRVWARYGLIRV